MRVHFLHQHVRYTVIILEEGNLPHPRFPRCNMQMPCKSLNGQHITTYQCNKGVYWKRQRLEEEYIRESEERAFQAYISPLETVTSFKYLGRFLTAADDDCPEVV